MTNGKNIIALVSVAAIAVSMGAYVAANGGSNAFHATAVNNGEALTVSFDGASMKLQMSSDSGAMVINHGASYSEKIFSKVNGNYMIASCDEGKGMGSKYSVKETGSGYQVGFGQQAFDVAVDGGVPTTVSISGKVYTVTSFGWGASASFNIDGDCAAAPAVEETTERALASRNCAGCRTWRANRWMKEWIYDQSLSVRRPWKYSQCTDWRFQAGVGSGGTRHDNHVACKGQTNWYGGFTIISTSGSDDLLDFLADACIIPWWSAWVGHTVHFGFWVEWSWASSPIRSWINARGDVLTTGHSLGGAVASYQTRASRSYSTIHLNTVGEPGAYWLHMASMWERRCQSMWRGRVTTTRTTDLVSLGLVVIGFWHGQSALKTAVRYDTWNSAWWAITQWKAWKSCNWCQIIRLIRAGLLHTYYVEYVGNSFCYYNDSWKNTFAS
jgi:hypothetical protein